MKIIFIFMIIYFSFNRLQAMETVEDSVINQAVVASARRPLLRLEYSATLEEEKEDKNTHAYNSLSFWETLFSCWGIFGRQKTVSAINSTDIKNTQINFRILPDELLLMVADYLSSVDVLRLSGVCRKFRKIFNENYWIIYLSKKPQAFSRLILGGKLSPSLQRKAFFSHLWYVENRISLAAQLGHPEAAFHQKYGSYGAYIGNDQYLCPSGVIKYASGKTDDERTQYFRDAQRKKMEEEMRRNEFLRKREVQMRNKYKGGSRIHFF